jgi:2-dehydro-3-deoxygluconokinase
MRICCAGEVMVELAGTGGAGVYRQGFAGDSYNTAIYLAREGLEVDYLTRLGDDSFSDAIFAELHEEGVGTGGIRRVAGRQPGLYIINNNEEGEREFHYWRDTSPARELFDQPLVLEPCRVYYFTGITLAVTRSGIENLTALLAGLKKLNTRIVFDPNYRPRLWQSVSQARESYREVLPYCDTVLPTLEDDGALWGIATPEESARIYRDYGASEIVVKGSGLVAHAFFGSETERRQAEMVKAVDTTGAGDSFNAAYLAARLRGSSVEAAIAAGQLLAAKVVQHRGALIPRSSAN